MRSVVFEELTLQRSRELARRSEHVHGTGEVREEVRAVESVDMRRRRVVEWVDDASQTSREEPGARGGSTAHAARAGDLGAAGLRPGAAMESAMVHANVVAPSRDD